MKARVKKVIFDVLRRQVLRLQMRGSGIYLDDSHRYWLLPPPFLRNDGSVPTGHLSGQRVLDWLKVHLGMRADARVLDVGCGDGRVGSAFARLGAGFSGLYRGFDIDYQRIDQLQQLFAGDPRFRFEHADIHHSTYNQAGRIRAQDYRYPYEDGVFDVVFYNSIFSHLKTEVILANLREGRRCLAPDGRIWATAYCLDEDYSEAESRRQFKTRYERGFTASPEAPELCVGYAKETLVTLFAEVPLGVEKQVAGYWKKPRRSLDQHEQDVFVLRKG